MKETMQEAVIISIRPEWTRKIRTGEKTVEVRRTYPGMVYLPFTAYIYETVAAFDGKRGTGAVIGEFICNDVFDIRYERSDDLFTKRYSFSYPAGSDCLSAVALSQYLGRRDGYGWNITELKIYDKPIPLAAFGMEKPPQSWRYCRKVEAE